MVLRIASLCLTICACSSSSDTCRSEVVGNWMGTSFSDSIAIQADGTFTYHGEGGCVAKGSFSCPSANIKTGSMTVSIDSTTGPNCFPLGDSVCQFTVNGSTLSYNFGLGTLQYKRN